MPYQQFNLSTRAQHLLKRVHVSGTAWFAFCALYLLIVVMRQVGLKWWVVFSFSSYALITFLFLLNVYLFAIFRGASRTQNTLEHPLTTSGYYIAFYDLCPLLGSISGFICYWMPGMNMTLPMAFSMMCEGTLTLTFLVWIVTDPLLGIAELMLPECTHYRKVRIQTAAEEKQRKQLENQQLLERLETLEAENLRIWERQLQPLAEKAAILLNQSNHRENARPVILEAGAKAWRLGGIVCMRYFHKMLRDKITQPYPDFVAVWWDGIGNWRMPRGFKALNGPA